MDQHLPLFAQVDGQNDSHATEWLLGDGAVQLGTLLQRPELGEAAPRSVAQRVLLLCHTLLAAARAEEENPERLQHTLQHLQPAAPTCLRWVRGLYERALNCCVQCAAQQPRCIICS